MILETAVDRFDAPEKSDAVSEANRIIRGHNGCGSFLTAPHKMTCIDLTFRVKTLRTRLPGGWRCAFSRKTTPWAASHPFDQAQDRPFDSAQDRLAGRPARRILRHVQLPFLG